jgi:DNA-binding IscR family transcriptional regulator
VTMMDVYEAIEGPLAPDNCFLGRSVCPAGECMFGGLIETVNALARKQLEGTVLSELAGWDVRRS